MATTTADLKQITLQDFKGKVDPDWCPGCGDFGVLAALQKALVELQVPAHTAVTGTALALAATTSSTPCAARQRRTADQPDRAGHRRRRHLRGPRIQRRTTPPDRVDQAGPGAQGFCAH